MVNRYRPEKPAVAFIQGIGLKQGALASSVAHDSHNIIMALLVIPELKLSDRGLFDGRTFQFTDLRV